MRNAEFGMRNYLSGEMRAESGDFFNAECGIISKAEIIRDLE